MKQNSYLIEVARTVKLDDAFNGFNKKAVK
jgi:hypothetical protein